MELMLDKVRKEFPSLNSDWIFMDNAGGSQILQKVMDRLNDYLLTSNVQLGASYYLSEKAGERVSNANKMMAELINANSADEIIMGSSTTMLLRQLALSMSNILKKGDEIIVTDCDHEANIGAWRNLEVYGIKIKEWKLNQDDFQLHLDDLEKLVTERTKLVALTNCSNILGTINPIKEIASFVHERGSLICVDGVAYVPHRAIDVQDLDVDFYVFSFYKLYGPHCAMLYGKEKHLKSFPSINHYFIEENDVPYKFQPGSQNYELSYSTVGVCDYFAEMAKIHGLNSTENTFNNAKSFFSVVKDHERALSQKLIEFLSTKPNVKIIGENSSDPNLRVPTVSFVIDDVQSNSITEKVDEFKIGIRYGHFYAKRLIDNLGLADRNGVIRVSMVHYNTIDEVDKLISILDKII
jgi:cysteine desulfurase family protein (TIGR01976 family)